MTRVLSGVVLGVVALALIWFLDSTALLGVALMATFIVVRHTRGWPVPTVALVGGSVAFPGFAELKRTGDAQADAMRAHTREFVAEMQAQRRVLFLVLDHLDGRSA